MRDAAMAGTLRRLAIEAGRRILAVRAEGPVRTAAKADESPVTAADLAADAIIVEGLAAAWPAIPVVTEERAGSHAFGGDRPHFLVDPLDGTKEFVQERGEFTVNIALIEDGRAVAGVVYAPAVGRLFRTAAGGGAVEERVADPSAPAGPEGALVSLRVAEADPAALRVVASKSHRDAETDAFIARFPVTAFKAAGSSLKFCLVAAGEADLYPRLGPTMEWDTAAGQAVLEAAGGAVLRLPDLAPMRYGAPERRNGAFVALGRGVRLEAA